MDVGLVQHGLERECFEMDSLRRCAKLARGGDHHLRERSGAADVHVDVAKASDEIVKCLRAETNLIASTDELVKGPAAFRHQIDELLTMDDVLGHGLANKYGHVNGLRKIFQESA